jgi:hypothetical protein
MYPFSASRLATIKIKHRKPLRDRSYEIGCLKTSLKSYVSSDCPCGQQLQQRCGIPVGHRAPVLNVGSSFGTCPDLCPSLFFVPGLRSQYSVYSKSRKEGTDKCSYERRTKCLSTNPPDGFPKEPSTQQLSSCLRMFCEALDDKAC